MSKNGMNGNRRGNGSAGAEQYTNVRDLGPCPTHGKRAYPSKAKAKQACREFRGPGKAGLSAYRCTGTEGMWHIGHLPKPVRRGEWKDFQR